MHPVRVRALSRRSLLPYAAVLAGAVFAPAAGAQVLPEGADLPAAYIAEADGKIVASRAPFARRQPASLAKLAAALVVLDFASRQPELLDSPAAVSANAARKGGTRLGLRAGDRVRVRELLGAMIVGSANDACVALVEHVAGTADVFSARMKTLASRLGMASTRFVDPCGLDRRGQHTTAADMLKLAHAALAEKFIVELAEKPAITVETLGTGRTLSMRNTNALLGRYEGAFGLKTGYTQQAGQCVIATARRGSAVAIVVILGGRDRWPVSAALLDDALDRATDVPRVRSRSTIGEPDS